MTLRAAATAAGTESLQWEIDSTQEAAAASPASCSLLRPPSLAPWTAGPLSQATAGGRTMGCRRLVKDTGRAHCRPRNSEANNFHSWSLCFHLSRLNILCIFRLALFPPPVSILCRIRCPPANDSRFNRTLSGPTVPAVSAFQYTPIIICDQQQGVAFDGNMADQPRDCAVCAIDPNPKSALFRP